MSRPWSDVTEKLTGDSIPELNNLYGVPFFFGVSSLGQGEVRSLDRDSDFRGVLGYGPLVRSVTEFFAHGGQKSKCLVRSLVPDTPGANGAVTQTGTGTATATLSGTPNDAYKIQIKVLTGGDTGTAVIKYSVDGGNNWAPKMTVPVDGVVAIGNTGSIMTFDTATNPLVADDLYEWDTTEPLAGNSVYSDAMDAELPTYRGKYEGIVAIGPSALAFWTLISGKVETEWNHHNPVFGVVEGTKYAEATKDADIAALIADLNAFTDRRVAVITAQLDTVDSFGEERERTGAGAFCGTLSKGKVSDSVGVLKDNFGQLIQAVDLSPANITETDLQLLNDSGGVVAKKYDGYPGIWWNNGSVMSAPGDPFDSIEEIRVAGKMIRLARVAALRNLHLDADTQGTGTFGGPAGLRYLEAELGRAVKPMEIDREVLTDSVAFHVKSTENDVYLTNGVNVQCDFVTMPKMKTISLTFNLISPDEFTRRNS